MSMVRCGKIHWPKPAMLQMTVAGINSFSPVFYLFNSTTNVIAWVGQATEDMTLTEIRFYLATVTTGCALDVRIESVVSGRPSGSLYAANSNGAVVVADGDDNAWKTATLTTPTAISRGGFFAIVFRYSSGATPSMQFQKYPDNYMAQQEYPLVVASSNSGGTWTTNAGGVLCAYAKTASGAVHLPNLTSLYLATTANAITSSSTPDEYALQFTVPFKCRVIGAQIMVANPATNCTLSAFLWADGVTDAEALASASVSGTSFYNVADEGYREVYFNTPVEINAGEARYLGVRSDGAGAFGVLSTAVDSGGADAEFGSGVSTDMAMATRTWASGTAGAWTVDAGRLPLFALIIDQLDDGISPPAYFADNEPVPFPDIQMQPQILYHNIFSFPGAFVADAEGWTNSGNGDIERLIDPYANVVWEADDTTASGTISFPHVVSANAIGIARHMLDGHTVTIEYSDDNGATWHVAGTFAPTAGRIMFQALEGVFTADLWRFTVEGDTPAQISHMSVGVVTAFERRMYAGVVPSLLNRDAKLSVGSGSGGQHVGDRFLRERVRQTFDVKHLTGEWVRVQGKPLMEFARVGSVFAAWRPGKYPLDVVYGWSDGDASMSHSGPASYMDFDITIEGIDSWQN